jgi:hypothetical protein
MRGQTKWVMGGQVPVGTNRERCWPQDVAICNAGQAVSFPNMDSQPLHLHPLNPAGRELILAGGSHVPVAMHADRNAILPCRCISGACACSGQPECGIPESVVFFCFAPKPTERSRL